MTQPTDRPGIDDLTSDMLDRLYAERDHAVRIARSAAFDTAKALTAQMLAEQRADNAEATLTAVRKLATNMRDWDGHEPAVDRWATDILDALDQHGQTPA